MREWRLDGIDLQGDLPKLLDLRFANDILLFARIAREALFSWKGCRRKLQKCQNHVDKKILGGKGLQYEDSTSITFVRPVYASLVPSDGAGRSILQTLKNIHLVAFCVVYSI